jgi:hypothetical protein
MSREGGAGPIDRTSRISSIPRVSSTRNIGIEESTGGVAEDDEQIPWDLLVRVPEAAWFEAGRQMNRFRFGAAQVLAVPGSPHLKTIEETERRLVRAARACRPGHRARNRVEVRVSGSAKDLLGGIDQEGHHERAWCYLRSLEDPSRELGELPDEMDHRTALDSLSDEFHVPVCSLVDRLRDILTAGAGEVELAHFELGELVDQIARPADIHRFLFEGVTQQVEEASDEGGTEQVEEATDIGRAGSNPARPAARSYRGLIDGDGRRSPAGCPSRRRIEYYPASREAGEVEPEDDLEDRIEQLEIELGFDHDQLLNEALRHVEGWDAQGRVRMSDDLTAAIRNQLIGPAIAALPRDPRETRAARPLVRAVSPVVGPAPVEPIQDALSTIPPPFVEAISTEGADPANEVVPSDCEEAGASNSGPFGAEEVDPRGQADNDFGLVFDEEEKIVRKEGHLVTESFGEGILHWKILKILASNGGEICTWPMLRKAWGQSRGQAAGEKDRIKSAMCALRKRVECLGLDVESVRSEGYRLCPKNPLPGDRS